LYCQQRPKSTTYLIQNSAIRPVGHFALAAGMMNKAEVNLGNANLADCEVLLNNKEVWKQKWVTRRTKHHSSNCLANTPIDASYGGITRFTTTRPWRHCTRKRALCALLVMGYVSLINEIHCWHKTSVFDARHAVCITTGEKILWSILPTTRVSDRTRYS
jgi:hypothetical protein